MVAKRKPVPEPAEQVAAQVAAQAVCAVGGCKRPVLHRGLCSAHWEDPRKR
jgi:hypothetical protein